MEVYGAGRRKTAFSAVSHESSCHVHMGPVALAWARRGTGAVSVK